MTKKTIKPFPFPVYFWPVMLLTLIGLLDSIYLSFSHYRTHTDILYTSFCAVSRSINCDTISQSTHSILFNVPVPVWGVLGYLCFGTLLLFSNTASAKKERMWHLLIVLAFFFSAYSIFLAYISKYKIGAYCIMCILSYGINFLLLYFSWIIKKRFNNNEFLNEFKQDVLFLLGMKKSVVIFLPILYASILLPFVFPDYWNFEFPQITEDIPNGITKQGYPWIGAINPQLEIIEYSDYMCFQCKKNHFYLRQIIANNPDKIRLVHKHFPMDREFNPLVVKPFHPGSGKLAIAAVYATKEGKFWKMNDLLYNIPKGIKKIDIRELAEKTGVNLNGLAVAPQNKAFRYWIKHDIAKGIKLGITGTPSYVIDGKVYQGQIPAKIIKTILK